MRDAQISAGVKQKLVGEDLPRTRRRGRPRASVCPTGLALSDCDLEKRLAESVGIKDLHQGVTTPRQRRERVREFLIQRGTLTAKGFAAILGAKKLRALYEQVYRYDLETGQVIGAEPPPLIRKPVLTGNGIWR